MSIVPSGHVFRFQGHEVNLGVENPHHGLPSLMLTFYCELKTKERRNLIRFLRSAVINTNNLYGSKFVTLDANNFNGNVYIEFDLEIVKEALTAFLERSSSLL